MLPHIQAARNVARVASLAVLLDLDQGRLEPAIANAAGVLRLARDLQPRGATISQLFPLTLGAVTVEYMLKPVLRHPRLTAAQCDKVLTLLADHQKQSIDAHAEALKSEYVTMRLILHDLADPQARDHAFELLGMTQADMPPERKALKGLLIEATPRQYAQATAALNRAYRDLHATAKLPPGQRLAKLEAVVGALPQSSTSERIIRGFIEGLKQSQFAFAESTTLNEARLHAMQALAAVRRWQILHKSLPTDLAVACREAKLTGVPTDPYHSDQPLKFLVLDREPAVYSVGKDGKDDGGRIDNSFNTKPGDLIFRLPPSP